VAMGRRRENLPAPMPRAGGTGKISALAGGDTGYFPAYRRAVETGP
jgi:hypothetical protein